MGDVEEAAVASLLDAAGLADRFRTAAGHEGGGVPSFAAADLSPEDLHERYVLRNLPVVLRSLHPGWAPLAWSSAHLRASSGSRSITVRHTDGAHQFGHPETDGMYTRAAMTVGSFLDALAAAEAADEAAPYYAAQLSLRHDFPELYADTRPLPPHLGALGPLWRGAPALYVGGAARTPLHFDAFDNLLCVVRGAKTLMLWPPGCAPLLYPGGGGEAIFSRADPFAPDLAAFQHVESALRCGGAPLTPGSLGGSRGPGLLLTLQGNHQAIDSALSAGDSASTAGLGLEARSPSPTPSRAQAFPRLRRALPLALHAQLGPGDALYLPCGWWHAVQSTPPPRESAIGISFWARPPPDKPVRAADGEAEEQEGGSDT